MSESNNHMLGHTLLRVTIGGLFLIMGLSKFGNPAGIIGMLSGLGFPGSTLFGWLLILSEIVFGAMLLVGYKVRFSAWPLAIVLAIAWVLVIVPTDGIRAPNSLFHLIAISGLITIALTGPGKYAMTKED